MSPSARRGTWSFIAPGPASSLADGRSGVNYAYRIGRTEVSGTQWVDFANAYARAYGIPSDTRELIDMVGGVLDFSELDGTTVVALPNSCRTPVRASWRMAARYCNWLHNDRTEGRAACESGAYDTSTFQRFTVREGFRDVSYVTDQLTRSPGARFWIPSLDEWLKASYYNPAQPEGSLSGWMRHPWNSNSYPNEPNGPLNPIGPRYGPPTITGIVSTGWTGYSFMGAYPSIQSPWGLLDVSGGVSEWTELASFVAANGQVLGTGARWALGMPSRSPFGSDSDDRFDDFWHLTAQRDASNVFNGEIGFRIAALVPSPTTAVIGVVIMFRVFNRSRRVS